MGCGKDRRFPANTFPLIILVDSVFIGKLGLRDPPAENYIPTPLVPFEGEGRSRTNGHKFRFLGNIELFEHPLSTVHLQGWHIGWISPIPLLILSADIEYWLIPICQPCSPLPPGSTPRLSVHLHYYCREPPPNGLRGYGGRRTKEWRAPGLGA